jgi:uncharacterized protein (TIGR02996 family)
MSSLHPNVRAALEEIKAQPDDDTHRLMLADWLEENGTTERDRGSFLRLQVRRANRPAWDPRRVIEEAEATRLFERHKDAWTGGLAPGSLESPYPAERGLLRLRIKQNEPQHLDRFLADEPLWAWTEAITLQRSYGEPPDSPLISPERLRSVFERVGQVFLHTPALARPWPETVAAANPERLTALLLMTAPDETIGTDWLLRQPIFPALRELWTALASQEAISEESYFPELRRLHVSCPTGVRQLFRSRRFPRVELLRVLQADPAGFADATGFPALRHLILDASPTEEGFLASLARSPLLASVTRLELKRMRLTADGLADLFSTSAPLASVQLEGGAIDREGIEAIRDARPRPDLREFLLRPAKGARGVVELLAAAPLLESLEMLDLATCDLAPRSVALLGRSPGMSRWRHLDLARTPLGEDGLRALLAAGQPLALESLDLAYCKLEPGAIHQLEPLARLAPHLMALELAGNPLDDDDLAWLASWDGLARIELLTLHETHADLAGVTALLRSPLLARCRYLRLPKGKVPSEMREDAIARFGAACC